MSLSQPPTSGNTTFDRWIFLLWKAVQAGTGGGGVSSFNTRTGDITLTSGDITGAGGAAASHTHGGGDITSAVANATAATKIASTNWTVEESGGKLLFKYGGVSKASLDSSGNLIVTGNVTAYGTP